MRALARTCLGAVLLALFAGVAVAAPGFSQTTPGVYTFTAPATGDYALEVSGAQGGGSTFNGSGGKGARLSGQVALNAGDILTLVVGGAGGASSDSGGGGGGSFAYIAAGSRLLLAAGGGGGTYLSYSAQPGIGASPNGSQGLGPQSGAGGQNGAGGAGGTATCCNGGEGSGGGGGGWLSAGTDGAASPGTGGGNAFSFSGGAAALGGAAGGLGGGGGSSSWGGGGGGGYSGGGGGGNTSANTGAGGGGGSFVDPAFHSVSTQDGVQSGHGSVTVSFIDPSPAAVPTLSDWAFWLLGAALAAGSVFYLQRRHQQA